MMDQGHLTPSPSEISLPIAVARPCHAREYPVAVLGAIDRWVDERWRFVAPRLLPAALALAGMLLVLAAMDHMASRCRGQPQGEATIYLTSEISGVSETRGVTEARGVSETRGVTAVAAPSDSRPDNQR